MLVTFYSIKLCIPGVLEHLGISSIFNDSAISPTRSVPFGNNWRGDCGIGGAGLGKVSISARSARGLVHSGESERNGVDAQRSCQGVFHANSFMKEASQTELLSSQGEGGSGQSASLSPTPMSRPRCIRRRRR
jgi:hypothetical protein